MVKLLEGKYALITGGGRGIGRAIALEYAKNGANIAIAALEQDELDSTIKEIEMFFRQNEELVDFMLKCEI